MPTVLATFYREVIHAVKDRRTTYQWAVVQRSTLEASMEMERIVFTVLPVILVMVYVMPILCTVEVLVLGKEAELFAYVTASHVVTLLIPMCLAGDSLSLFRNEVSNGAYNGPWTEERPFGRYFRLHMMRASFGVAGRLRGIGIGALDRRSCIQALKSWYNFVQFFRNFSPGAPR
ncbi:uncharacterized protein LOC117647434 isoform X2 [Thrips palmi]|uniref:Uncharacterized protein LOC117647434 isoform X2 n=1 Tax=Thrips palmi TaxID=161013 RepID=A0A6P8ZBF2_THRPL|nr:uncharacterized protein LOC117647434 isoform X2 [Thrips palmi]